MLIILIVNSGCPKPCIEANYSFAVTAQFTPDLDSVKVGDTIYLISTFPTALKDIPSGNMIKYKNSAEIGSNLFVYKINNSVFPGIDAVDKFDYVSILGLVYNDANAPSPNHVQQLRYQFGQDSFHLKIGLVTKDTGVYELAIVNGLGVTKDKGCEKAAFNITLANTNQHINYFLSPISPYELPRVYFFKVY
ncbi:MAG: hypothetical protein ABIR81_01440 [Ginsengibacter sp.]